MNFDDNEEDCTIYIEELKSDDPNLKMNAIVKIQQIGQILGPTRLREELVPYIIEIIEELDNEDEFLLKLAEQVLLLNKLIGGKQYSHLLISPLEILSSMEEATVREKAVDCLIQIAKDQDEGSPFFSDHFLPMLRQLSGWDNYPSRISACSLVGACYSHFKEEERRELIQIFQELCRDDTPMVRRTAAENIGVLCAAPVTTALIVKQDLLPMWMLLIGDDVDSVKVKTLESSVLLAEKLQKREVGEGFVPKLKETITAKHSSWRVRYAVAEVVGPLIQFLEKDLVRKDVLKLFEELLKDSEHEVRSIAILQLPLLCDTLTDTALASQIQPQLSNLVSDSQQHVRISLAEVICKIAGCFDKKAVLSGILPIIETLLKDDVLDVRLTLMKNFALLNMIIGSDNIKKFVVPLFNNIQNEKQWRFRLSFCEFLPKFYKQLGWDTFNECFSESIKLFFRDHYHAVREQNFENLREIGAEGGYEKIKDILAETLVAMRENSNYIFRITALDGVCKLKELTPRDDLANIFEALTEKLLDDKVPNVQIKLLKTFLSVQDRLSANVRQRFIQRAAKLKDNTDFDVSYYA